MGWEAWYLAYWGLGTGSKMIKELSHVLTAVLALVCPPALVHTRVGVIVLENRQTSGIIFCTPLWPKKYSQLCFYFDI